MTSKLEYLKKYTSKDQDKPPKTKKLKAGVKPSRSQGIIIVDNDALWKREAFNEEEEEDEKCAPVVIEDEEEKRRRRIALRQAKYGDTGGWVTIQGGGEASAGPSSGDGAGPQGRAVPVATRDGGGLGERGAAQRRGGDSPDLSPPRKGRHDSPDLSPPRKGRHDSPDLSPPRKGRHESPDLSPPRKGRHDSPDLSPPRKRQQGSPVGVPQGTAKEGGGSAAGRRKSRWQQGDVDAERPLPQAPQGDATARAPASGEAGAPAPAVRMSDGTLAGLRTGKELAEEIARTREEERLRFQRMDPTLTGRAHATVYRDKVGRRLPGPPGADKGSADKPADKPIAWGKGLAQKKEIQALLEEMEAEKSKPFARTRDDPDLDRMLRNRTRFGDPMAHLLGNKGAPGDEFGHLVAPARSAEELEGFCVPQEVPAHSWVRRGVAPPENRYGIRPGRHWDGVDRSNGFEHNYFLQVNQKKTVQDEAYLWSVADM